MFVNLENGEKVGLTRVSGIISSLRVCRDDSLEIVSLLITNKSRQQWRLILEQRTNNYVYPLNHGNGSSQNSSSSKHTDNPSDEVKTFPPTRSRLQGLKQLSVEKLASLKQKLAETRNRNLAGNIVRQGALLLRENKGRKKQLSSPNTRILLQIAEAAAVQKIPILPNTRHEERTKKSINRNLNYCRTTCFFFRNIRVKAIFIQATVKLLIT